MPIHDWTRVDAGIFHDFHTAWTVQIKATLNSGLLPPDYYALTEQITSGLGPDVVTLQHPTNKIHPAKHGGPVAVKESPPVVQFRIQAEPDRYAAKAKTVAIRHSSDHRVIAVIEIVSPGNKNSRHGLQAFVSKAVELLRGGIHLLILDLFPPGPRDPEGIHRAIWDEFSDSDFRLPEGFPLTLAAYRADQWPEAFVEPTRVGQTFATMPVFLSPDEYVPLPLEATYLAAWELVPPVWRAVVES